MMFTYKKARYESLYTVGYYEPPANDVEAFHEWRAIEDFGDEEDARRLVNYLNGGTGELFPRR
jgi:serine phosphatase RsbU (regulator of sigma subunit)